MSVGLAGFWSNYSCPTQHVQFSKRENTHMFKLEELFMAFVLLGSMVSIWYACL
jgi:hypothetical protein